MLLIHVVCCVLRLAQGCEFWWLNDSVWVSCVTGEVYRCARVVIVWLCSILWRSNWTCCGTSPSGWCKGLLLMFLSTHYLLGWGFDVIFILHLQSSEVLQCVTSSSHIMFFLMTLHRFILLKVFWVKNLFIRPRFSLTWWRQKCPGINKAWFDKSKDFVRLSWCLEWFIERRSPASEHSSSSNLFCHRANQCYCWLRCFINLHQSWLFWP